MRSLRQHLLPSRSREIECEEYPCKNIEDLRQQMCELGAGGILGVSLKLAPDGALEAVALSTAHHVALLTLGPRDRAGALQPFQRSSDERGKLPYLAAFDMAAVALHLYRELRCDVRGVDLSTLLPKSGLMPSKVISDSLDVPAPREIDALWDDDGDENLALRAWISCVAAIANRTSIRDTLKVKTSNVEKTHLLTLCRLVQEVHILRAARPRVVENDFTEVTESGQAIQIENSRYKSRVRVNPLAHVVIHTTDGRQIVGQACGVKGKATKVAVRGAYTGTAQRIRIVGREQLRGELPADGTQLNRLLWWPQSEDLSVLERDAAVGGRPPLEHLNESQAEVVRAMIAGTSPLVVAHGPPGTGKTTTIRAAAEIWASRGEPVWIVAQSNVAVKNIAESLCKRKIRFKLLVAKEFHEGWHEHLYEALETSLIRSDELEQDPLACERQFGDTSIVLCTLGMLSNPGLDDRRVFEFLPVEKLVIDEASQISAFEYMHLFAKFQDLEHVAMFGDPKQLPPYGQETAPSLQSIFEIKHLKRYAYFLNTQYRMPRPIGDFISEHVYNSKLRSEHAISSASCVKFVDAGGREERDGKSWRNMREVQTIVHLVAKYYRHLDFRVLTPYDAQRAALQQALKSAGLPWEDVYNVDSFQGNEADYILLSVVRSASPGFLASLKRANVMLTRCKKGMVLVTSATFLQYHAERTLVGRLERRWRETYGEAQTWTDWKRVAERRADLPGVAPTTCGLPSAPPSLSATSSSESRDNVHPMIPRTKNAERLWSQAQEYRNSINELARALGGFTLPGKERWPDTQAARRRSGVVRAEMLAKLDVGSEDQFPSLNAAMPRKKGAQGAWSRRGPAK